MTLLEVSELRKSFGGVQAVNRVNIEVNAGEIVALVGPNGAGKSTIFNLVTGFLRPDGGMIRYMGETILGLRPDQIAKRGIGRTFQSPLIFHGKTMLESLLAGYVKEERTGFWHALFNTDSYRLEEKQARQRGLEILEFLQLTEWKDTLVSALPCGILRFIGIAQVIMSSIKILLLDEPLTGLNEEEISQMLSKLKRLQEQGMTILIIEHHMKAVMTFCERIIVISFGKNIAQGTPAEIKDNPAVIEAYLGAKRGRRNVS
ncbi:MAG: ABC transporter ATP-binding protein [Deltaproteobacteria bacterium]